MYINIYVCIYIYTHVQLHPHIYIHAVCIVPQDLGFIFWPLCRSEISLSAQSLQCSFLEAEAAKALPLGSQKASGIH